MNESKTDVCSTRYPVMLVHGTSAADRRSPRTWRRIPSALADNGAMVCFGKQDAWGSVQSNKLQLAKSVDEALKLYNTEKINIIAHSKGGLDARALASLPGYESNIASITTISTPHRGIGWLSKLWPFGLIFFAAGTVLLYPFLRLLCGDKRPNPYRLLKDMTHKGCERFNLETPDRPEIFYQSYAGKMSKNSQNNLLLLSRLAANKFDGENDGMISVESAKWGLFKGVISGSGKRGLSHTDEIDFFKRNYEGADMLTDGIHTYSDVPQIYIRIVRDLKELGF